jgi:hypothetical protein
MHAGDHVYLQPAVATAPLYIAKLVDLFQVPAAAPASGMYCRVSWLYRPSEVVIDSPLPLDEGEVFAADEEAVHPLESVAGHCWVVRPGDRREHGADTFVCGRKYIPAEA